MKGRALRLSIVEQVCSIAIEAHCTRGLGWRGTATVTPKLGMTCSHIAPHWIMCGNEPDDSESPFSDLFSVELEGTAGLHSNGLNSGGSRYERRTISKEVTLFFASFDISCACLMQSFLLFQHAHALEALCDHLKPGAHVLDVGSGSGYLTACMALLVCIYLMKRIFYGRRFGMHKKSILNICGHVLARVVNTSSPVERL